ncbi:conserved domain protein [Trichinella spiralis]|uniref:hypothetical protein n=1 Tax=Trichinella spiralis TaxID=6334 RepID=UPI0001EFDAA8|nr:conserved domain protein [Trichinella spiralis]
MRGAAARDCDQPAIEGLVSGPSPVCHLHSYLKLWFQCQLAYCHCPAWLSQHPAPITVMRIAAVCCRRRRGDVRRRLGRKRKKLRPTQRGKNERRRRNWALITLHPFLKPLVVFCMFAVCASGSLYSS